VPRPFAPDLQYSIKPTIETVSESSEERCSSRAINAARQTHSHSATTSKPFVVEAVVQSILQQLSDVTNLQSSSLKRSISQDALLEGKSGMEKSKIEWTDCTFNPWIGCQHVSPGCDHCYAEAMMDRWLGKVKWGPHGRRMRTSQENWKQPQRWNAQARAFKREHGCRPRVFSASLADVFDNQVPKEWRVDLFALIRECRRLDWLILTKRPQNIAKMLPKDWGGGYRNVWLGVTGSVNKAIGERMTT